MSTFLVTLLLGLSHVAAATLPTALSGFDLVSGHEVEARASSKGTVIVFLSAKCPCSASHEPVLAELAREYQAKGFTFIGVHSNADEGREMAESHFKGIGLPFPVLQDDGSRWANAFGALKTPHTYVVGPRGEVLYQGGVDETHNAAEAKKPFLRDALAAIAQGKSPETRETRVLGCVIKR